MEPHSPCSASIGLIFLLLLLLSLLGRAAALACLQGGSYDGVKCICPQPYYGLHCEEGHPTPTEAPPTYTTDTDSSSPAPCQNGGLYNGAQCTCLPGYWGLSCQFSDTRDCQNGGVWVETACRCPHDFWGPRCEFVVNVIEVNTEVKAWVDMEVKVTNRNFSEELANSSSGSYKDFAWEFIQQVDEVYQKEPRYRGVAIVWLRPGSIAVKHKAWVLLPLSASTREELQNVSSQLASLLSVAVQGKEPGCQAELASLCFEASSIKTLGGNFRVNGEEICRGSVPVAFSPYFSGRTTEHGFECATRCAKDHPARLDCKHGQCQVSLLGPQCYCPATDTSWVLGDQCGFHISKMGLSIALPLAVTLAVALALAVVQARQPRSSR